MGGQAAGRPDRPRRGHRGGRHPGRCGPARLRGPGRPGRRHPPPDGHRLCPREVQCPAGRRRRRFRGCRRSRGTRMKVAIAGAGQRGDRHRRRPPRRGPRRPGHRAGSRRWWPGSAGDLDITWVVADACEVSSLDAAGLATVDVVVAATGDDEDNLVVSLLAKQEFAVPRVVARVNHPKNQWLFTESLGRRRLGVHPPAAHRPGRGGGVGGQPGPPPPVRRGQRPPGRGDPGRGLAGRRGVPGRSRACPARPPWWRWSGTTT